MAAEASEKPTQIATPNIYAELLPRLGRISVVIHLPSPSTHKTKVLISSDALHLIVYHEDVTTKLRLPARTRTPAGEHLAGEVRPGLDKMSWRLVSAPEQVQSGLVVDDAVPWSASQLSPGTRITCRACDDVVVAEDKLKTFKDLPSENWAEMMELWHCHKPTNGHASTAGSNGTSGHDEMGQAKASETDLASRGYGASSAIVAQKGTGFVDVMTMLFHEDDCSCLMGIKEGFKAARLAHSELPKGFQTLAPAKWSASFEAESQADHVSLVAFKVVDVTGNIPGHIIYSSDGHLENIPLTMTKVPYNALASDQVSSEDPSGFRSLDAFCRKCRAQLGRFDSRKDGVSLFKWKLNMGGHTGGEDSLTSSSRHLSSSPTLSHCLAAALVATQARSGSAKVVLQGEKEAVTLWILNPSIRFSCLTKQCVSAMKLLYRSEAMDEEEINVPDEVIGEVKAVLEQGNTYLPPDEKVKGFGGQEGTWTVSLLERWQPST